MEKNTVIAVILSVIIITASFILQGIFFPPPEGDAFPPQVTEQPAPDHRTETGQDAAAPQPDGRQPAVSGFQAAEIEDEPSIEPFVYRNDMLQVTFDPRGGRVTSLQLLAYEDGETPVDMVMADPDGRAAFDISFGGVDEPIVRDAFFRRSTGDDHTIEFYRDFQPEGAEPFTLIRRYRFYPGEYLFRVETEIQNSVNQLIPLNVDNAAYTLHYGPQIGPRFEVLDQRTDYRRFSYFDGRRKRDENLRQGEIEVMSERPRWAGINGKYFAVVAVPGTADYRIHFDTRQQSPLSESHTLSLVRPPISSSRNTDSVLFYAGPKISSALGRYDNSGDNALGVSGLELEEIMDSRFLGWFENILKSLLEAIYRVVPNYGVSIVIMTILVKLLLWPLTKKSFESTAKSQALQPKIQELREKYKDKPEKLNAEMMAMYKKEGVNPLGGCFPMLLQMPLLLAMFGLFNNHFDLRGATFIPGWIEDLSAPESIFYFGDYFSLPILGWTDIRLLPILFVASQLLFGRFSQPAGSSNSQAKMFTTFMPIMFFFILYNMPSGLLVYWIITNILSVVQQLGTTKYRQGHPQHEKHPAPAPKKSGRGSQGRKKK
ncbi:membrane protein insertase YidC [Spirochaeta africana]|uniref:Membrane protein insertase YidC n=1 Tax=Spirochaeta africana (strain ATCC 700263 / DSM 8902 / Z-7692) TaxID=889378 RepID=H9UF24_SPIAZ|nr:membrane protein insertase YidC [Spirochaeta africana]AFG36117.1 membrane protein insertase, YidC/Oxa1 family, N-terminal domain protein [Spirochaeta africana DSM 8902]